MAGGSFLAQNKVRPGAYINFKAVPAPSMNVGARGVVALPYAAGWGDEVIELYSSELADGTSLQKVGVNIGDDAALLYRLVLSHAYKVIIARTDLGSSAAKASATVGSITATARYKGSFGNRISIIVKEFDAASDSYEVTTAVDGIGRDTQRIRQGDETLASNNWVDFTIGSGDIEETAGTALTGGVSTTEGTTSLTDAIHLLSQRAFNTLAVMSSDSTVKQAAILAIKQLRDDEGRKVQAVLYDAAGLSGADYEGIISSKQGYKTQDYVVTPLIFIAELAAITAGATVVDSNTYKTISGALEIVGGTDGSSVNPFATHDQIESALQHGWLALSYRSDGVVIIEQDINTLCNDLSGKSYAFKKNRVIRTLDEIGNTVSLTWAKTYCGKVTNNAVGRDLFKADLIQYLRTLQDLGAIQNFDADEDIAVNAGTDIDAVIAELYIQPADAMEKLYMTVNVQ